MRRLLGRRRGRFYFKCGIVSGDLEAAKLIAEPIGKFLSLLKTHSENKLHIIFVAHSLGCRVVLETLLQLSNSEMPIFVDVVLLAAAVPETLLHESEKLRAGLTKAPDALFCTPLRMKSLAGSSEPASGSRASAAKQLE